MIKQGSRVPATCCEYLEPAARLLGRFQDSRILDEKRDLESWNPGILESRQASAEHTKHSRTTPTSNSRHNTRFMSDVTPADGALQAELKEGIEDLDWSMSEFSKLADSEIPDILFQENSSDWS